MGQKSLARWLKIILLGVALCGAVVYAGVIPTLGKGFAWMFPDLSHCFWPWLIFWWVSGVPCYGVLVLGWRIASNIGRDRSFCIENAKLLQWISVLAAGDAGFFFLGNVVFLLWNWSHPSVVLGSLLIVFAGVAVAVAAAALSHLVKKAAVLQEESDWTI